MHEIGHALGLAHPGDYKTGVYAGQEDNRIDTIMSYRPSRPYADIIRDGYGSVLQSESAALRTLTPARYDILALQQMLGVNTTTAGNANKFNDFKDAYWDNAQRKWVSLEYRTILDAGENDGDVIDASTIISGVKINLEPGTASSIGAPDKNLGTKGTKGVRVINLSSRQP